MICFGISIIEWLRKRFEQSSTNIEKVLTVIFSVLKINKEWWNHRTKDRVSNNINHLYILFTKHDVLYGDILQLHNINLDLRSYLIDISKAILSKIN